MTLALEDKIALIRSAIIHRKQVVAVYNGHERLFCPHILGTKSGGRKTLVWQFGGSSSKPQELPLWRDFSVAGLAGITLRDGDWHRGWETGQRTQKAIDHIDTVVDPAYAAELRQISPRRTPARGSLRLGRKI